MSRTSAKKGMRNGLTAKAEMAFKEAIERVKEEHRRSGEPMAIWRGGRVVFVHPDEDTLSHKELRESHTAYKSKKIKRRPRTNR